MSGKECRPQQIVDVREQQFVIAKRQSAAFQFLVRGARKPLVRPSVAYAVAFARRTDPTIAVRVGRLFQRAQKSTDLPKSGYIYVFHDRESDSDIVKIGKTESNPYKRLAEWQSELAPNEETSVDLLCAYRASDVTLAELVVHETLLCERQRAYVNPVTQRQLTEFFRVDNALALQIFVRQAVAFVNAFTRKRLQGAPLQRRSLP